MRAIGRVCGRELQQLVTKVHQVRRFHDTDQVLVQSFGVSSLYADALGLLCAGGTVSVAVLHQLETLGVRPQAHRSKLLREHGYLSLRAVVLVEAVRPKVEQLLG